MPANAECQSPLMPMTHRNRGQARSYSRHSSKRVPTADLHSSALLQVIYLNRTHRSNADKGNELFALSVPGQSFGEGRWQFGCLGKAKPLIKPAKLGLTE